MRYDKESDLIYASVRELVRLSRRGISSSSVRDEDEPYAYANNERAREKYINSSPTELSYRLEYQGRRFLLRGAPDGVLDGEITLLYTVDARGGRVRKEDKEEARGEGFIYGYMLAECEKRDIITLTVIYLDRDGELVDESREQIDINKLSSFFDKCIEMLGKYAAPEIERVTVRLPSFEAAKFPFLHIREGQREFMNRVYRTLRRGSVLTASAPTGTGKTVSVIYPALRAMGECSCEKTFYLTPKRTTALAAKECLELFAEHGCMIRAVNLSSKESLCTEDNLCRLDARKCPKSKWSNLPDATLALWRLNKTVIDRQDLLSASDEWGVCAHELGLCYAELCDFVICDFNYLFDTAVYIRRFFDTGGDYAFLIDEAHNLPERAREMYSEELSLSEISSLISNAILGEHSQFVTGLSEYRDVLWELLSPLVKEEIRRSEDGEAHGAVHLSELPGGIYSIIDGLYSLSLEFYRATQRARDEEKFKRLAIIKPFYYKITKLSKIIDLFDSAYKLFLFYDNGDIRLKLFSVDTGRVLKGALDKGRAAVFFSATLSPLEYYRALLGGEGETVEVESPFDPEQLSVTIIDKISTRYSERERTLPSVVRTVGATMSAKKGNYMVFAPSFEYAEAIYKCFTQRYPKIRAMLQTRDMSAEDRRKFLDEFKQSRDGYMVGFCVMGGIYSEGVDLAGDSLIGAIIVGIGMPVISYEREAMREYFEEKYERGAEYAYLYPGMNRVLQAAGRVIRREDDRGVIVLIDDRFADPIYKKIIPNLWAGMEYVGDIKELKSRISKFWDNQK